MYGNACVFSNVAQKMDSSARVLFLEVTSSAHQNVNISTIRSPKEIQLGDSISL